NQGSIDFNTSATFGQLINKVPLTLPAGRDLTAGIVTAYASTFAQLANVDASSQVGVGSITGVWDQQPGTTTTSRGCEVHYGSYLLAPNAQLALSDRMLVADGGHFEQSGGHVTVNDPILGLGSLGISNGSYTISAGTLLTGTCSMAAASFQQSGGV